MNKRYLYGTIAVVVLAVAGYFIFRKGPLDEITYRTEKVTRGDVTVQVRATGTINPVRTVRVGSQVSGTIARLFADYNSQVKEGQIIAIIDSTFLNASVKEAEANLERNRAQMNEAERTLNRVNELFKKDLVSTADLDAAQTGYEAAAAQMKQAQASLDRVRVNLRYAIIRAPIDGVVISRDVDVGQTVAASLQAPQIFTIANDLKQMQVEASVDEADIGQIREGQSVTFSVDAYPDEEFRGRVSQVRLAPVTIQNVVTYTVIIEVPNEEMKLRPGMTATVSILVKKLEDVLRVPSLALRFQPPREVLESMKPAGAESTKSMAERSRRPGGGGDDSSGRFRRRMNREGGQREEGFSMKHGARPFKREQIWILDEEKMPKSVSVQIGLNDNRYVELSSGDIKEGDEVIIGMTGGESSSMSPQQSNPFAPRMPGGGGGGGGRRGP